jgi:hypothetical protein
MLCFKLIDLPDIYQRPSLLGEVGSLRVAKNFNQVKLKPLVK